MLSDTDFAENPREEQKTDFYSAAQNFIFFSNFSLLPKTETCFLIIADTCFMIEFTCLICLSDLFILTVAYIIEISKVDGQLQSAGT